MNLMYINNARPLPSVQPSCKIRVMSKLSLDRILQSQGFGTRKYCRALIEDGEVSIAGVVHDKYKETLETDGLVLTVFEEEWVVREHVYIALYKPANFECSRKPSHHPGVLTLLPEQFTWREVQPVGRLDHDTTGMLLMSDDGPFIHAQSSPKRHVPKIYQATTQDPVTDDLVAQLLGGVQLHDEPVEAYLALTDGGRQIELGAFLSPEERRALKDELELALRQLRR